MYILYLEIQSLPLPTLRRVERATAPHLMFLLYRLGYF
jgi:hypothetical protein